MKEAYYQSKASVKEYIKLAKDASGKELIKKLMRFLAPGANILELGSGPGTDWRILSDTHSVTGSDNSLEFIAYLRSQNPLGEFLELNAVTMETNRKFDGIYSNKVLHHLKDDEMTLTIKRQYQQLNPDGIVCHSFWKGAGSEIFRGLFVNYHSAAILSQKFENHFEILSIEEYKEFEDNDSLLLIGKKKTFQS